MITDEKRNLRHEQLQMAAQLEHNGVLKEINLTAQSHSERMIFQAGNATPRLPSERPVRRNHKRMKRDLRLELGRIILSKNLEMTGPKFVERLGAELGVQFGARAKISKNTAYADFAALRANQRELVGQDNVKPLIES